MALTSSQSEKFAFLFSGSVTSRYLNDLERVYTTLADYYGYPSNKVWVVLGSDPGMTTGTPPVPVIDSYPGLKAATNKTIINGSEPALLAAFTAFATDATTPYADPPEPTNVALIYCTGLGGNTGGSQLDITGAGTFSIAGTFVTPAWFNTRFTTAYIHTPVNRRFAPTAYVHLVMQQEYSGGFLSCINTVPGLIWSFTSACGSTEPSSGLTDGDTSGGYFTLGWTNALRLVPNASGQFADEIDFVAGSDILYHVQLARAKKYASLAQYGSPLHTLICTPSWGTSGEVHYLGIPELYIRDGVPYHESPDLWLTRRLDTSYEGDLYDCDDVPPITPLPDPVYNSDDTTWIYNNIINIRAWNIGTHPVRLISAAAELFRTGLSQANKQQRIENQVPNASTSGVLKTESILDVDNNIGTESAIIRWNYPFFEGITHGCVLAELELISTDLDFTWVGDTGLDETREAQRNLDPDPACSPPPPIDESGTEPDSGDEIPEEPVNGGEEEGTGTDNGSKTFRGIKEHIYGIFNPSKKTRKFILLFPDEYLKYRKYLVLDWYDITGKKRNKPQSLEIRVENNRLFIPFTLAAGETVDILSKLRVNHKFRELGEVKLPFSILIDQAKTRILRFKRRISPIPKFRYISGFTVKTWPMAVTLEGQVYNRARKPMPKLKIHIETGNKQRFVKLITDKYGAFKLSNISPDIYRLWVETGKEKSKVYLVNLTTVRHRKIDIYPEGKTVKK